MKQVMEFKKHLGKYLVDLLAISFVFVAYLIGHFVNGIPPEVAVMIATTLALTQGFLAYAIKRAFGLPTDDEKIPEKDYSFEGTALEQEKVIEDEKKLYR